MAATEEALSRLGKHLASTGYLSFPVSIRSLGADEVLTVHRGDGRVKGNFYEAHTTADIFRYSPHEVDVAVTSGVTRAGDVAPAGYLIHPGTSDDPEPPGVVFAGGGAARVAWKRFGEHPAVLRTLAMCGVDEWDEDDEDTEAWDPDEPIHITKNFFMLDAVAVGDVAPTGTPGDTEMWNALTSFGGRALQLLPVSHISVGVIPDDKTFVTGTLHLTPPSA